MSCALAGALIAALAPADARAADSAPRPSVESAVSTCLKPYSAIRTGTPACWIRALPSDPALDGMSLCLSREIWLAWLRSESGGPCGRFSGKWKASAALRDEPERTLAPKPVLQRFHASEVQWDASRPSPLWKGVEKKREALSSILAPIDPRGVLRSLALDERAPESDIGMLRLLGFVHLQSATGIHLYALASLWRGALAWIGLWVGLSSRAATQISRLAAAAAWLYAWLLCGARAGMLRPLALVSARTAAETAGFRWRRWSPLALALLLDFGAALCRTETGSSASGRLFYALAVGGGMMAVDRHSAAKLPVWRQHLALAVGSWVFVALWEIWESGVVAPFTPLWSVATIPVYGLLVYPALLLSSLNGGTNAGANGWEIALLALNGANQALELMIRLSAALPSIWAIGRAALIAGALGACVWGFGDVAWGGAFCGLRERRGFRTAAVVTLAFVALLTLGLKGLWGFRPALSRVSSRIAAAHPPARSPVQWPAQWVEQLDVGQGDAALVRRLGEIQNAGLIDTGSERALRPERWLALLGRRGIADGLDWVALTHLDEDHSGGLRRLSALVPIGCVATSREEIESDRGQRLKRLLELRGIPLIPWESGCFPFQAMGPAERSPRKAEASGNARMSAVFVPLGEPGSAASGGYLSAGDADARDELRFARWFAQLRSPSAGPWVLKLSHHGSRFSSAPEFIRAARPSEAWVSSGVGNRYGHPSAQATETVRALGIPLRRTDLEGTLRIEFPLREGVFRRRRRKRPP